MVLRWPIDSVAREHVADAIREFTIEDSVQDNRPVMIAHWQEATTRLMSPIIVASSLLGRSGVDELLVGSTRLGNLPGLLERGEVPRAAPYRVRLGRRIAVGLRWRIDLSSGSN